MTGIEELLAVGGTAAAADTAPLAAGIGALGAGATALAPEAVTAAVSSIAAPAATAGLSTGTILSLAGTGLGALQQLRAGQAAKSASDYNAAIESQQAGAEEAASQRTAYGQNQQTQLLLSRARAAGAASGATATSPSVISDESQIEGRGDLNAMMDLYNGESRAQALREGASLQEYQGEQAENAAPLRALSTIMSGASSLYTRYSPNPFSTSGTALNNPY